MSVAVAVLMLRSPLFSWFVDTVLIFSMCSFPLCSIARSTCAFKLRGFIARRLAMVMGFRMFTMTSRSTCVDEHLALAQWVVYTSG